MRFTHKSSKLCLLNERNNRTRDSTHLASELVFGVNKRNWENPRLTRCFVFHAKGFIVFIREVEQAYTSMTPPHTIFRSIIKILAHQLQSMSLTFFYFCCRELQPHNPTLLGFLNPLFEVLLCPKISCCARIRFFENNHLQPKPTSKHNLAFHFSFFRSILDKVQRFLNGKLSKRTQVWTH